MKRGGPAALAHCRDGLGAESSRQDDAFRPAGCWTGTDDIPERAGNGRLTGVSVLMVAVVALLPTCLLGILALTSRLEQWLGRATELDRASSAAVEELPEAEELDPGSGLTGTG
jgi:hypothetical protein